jgi:CRP-like cAMP-binding protein
MYFLAQGECEVLVRDWTMKETFVRDIFSGQLFGEVALLYNTKRTASIRSKNDCTVGAMNGE